MRRREGTRGRKLVLDVRGEKGGDRNRRKECWWRRNEGRTNEGRGKGDGRKEGRKDVRRERTRKKRRLNVE